MVPIVPPRCFLVFVFFFSFLLSPGAHICCGSHGLPAALHGDGATPKRTRAQGGTQLSSSLQHHFDLARAHPRGAGVPLSGSPLPFVPVPCPWGELEAEPHRVRLLPKPTRASSRRGEGAWGEPWGLHAARGWGWRTFSWWCQAPRPSHAAPSRPFISQRPDSEALEREEVARWVQLGAAKDWKVGQEGDSRVPRPCYRDLVIDRSSAQGWDLLWLARRGG